jgi:membrane-associated phospholipid phosphatase
MSLGIPEILILIVVFLGIVGTIFWIKMIIDCATREKDHDRLIWILIIVFTHFIGALIYYFVQRPKSAGAVRT